MVPGVSREYGIPTELKLPVGSRTTPVADTVSYCIEKNQSIALTPKNVEIVGLCRAPQQVGKSAFARYNSTVCQRVPLSSYNHRH